jgi:hypothetical protein
VLTELTIVDKSKKDKKTERQRDKERETQTERQSDREKDPTYPDPTYLT